jgi:uncharacterized membrane protein
VRVAVLTIALLFIAMLGALTIADIAHYGFTALDVVAILILVPFSVGVIGALRNPPRE